MNDFRYRVDLFLPRGGWHTAALFASPKEADEWGYSMLQPSGPALAYRVRRARKQDYALLRDGLWAEDPDNPGVARPVEVLVARERRRAYERAGGGGPGELAYHAWPKER